MTNKTRIEILDSNLNLVTWLQSPYPLDKSGTLLMYSKELSDAGVCTFRVSSYDTLFTKIGDIITPHQYHVRIMRNGVNVWQGAIIDNPKRTKDFVEVKAAEYVWYLNKILVGRTSNNPATGDADGVYRIFQSGSMADAVNAVMNETIARWAASNHALASVTIGTVENPDYPPNMTNANGDALTGGWVFGDGQTNPQLTFDFHSVMYVMKSFGAYSYADFNIDSNMKFNFKKFLGNDNHQDVNFTWGEHGNAEDFNVTRLGERMTNDLWGIAVDNNGKILHIEQTDEPSKKVNGILEQVAAYSDIKDQGTLDARIQAEMPLISTPDASADTFVLSEKAYPLGVYDIGDIITAKVDHVAVQYNEVKRIVGISVSLNDTGREMTTVQLNTPLPFQYGAS